MQRKHALAACAILATLLLTSTGCTNYKQVPYLQNSEEVDLSASRVLFDARIMPKDILSIDVFYPEDNEAAESFNIGALSSNSGGSGSSSSTTYLVDNNGNITFPLLGELHVGGLTKGELEEVIADKIAGAYLKNKPLVTVSMENFKFCVLGEVGSPGVKTISNGRVNIFEAIAMAGDLTIYGRRKDVKLIREDQYGEKSIVELDLTDANIINSPYYHLQQNDILYVTPNKIKSRNSDLGAGFTIWFTLISMLMSTTNFILNLTD